MNTFNAKIRLIFVPFLIIAICIIAGYSFLNWLLFIKLHAVNLNEEVIKIWIPMLLPWIPILVWLRPRIKLLNLKRKKGDLPGLYMVIAGFAVAIPTIIAQSYIETATGRLTQLDNISRIEKQEATKYYSLKNFYLDKQNAGVKDVFDVSGKSNQYFNMNIYVALPILENAGDTSGSECLAWYGIKYHKQISNRLGQQEKEERFQKFAEESQANFDSMDLDRFVYLDRIGNTDDHKGYISAIKQNRKYAKGSTAVLVPVNEPFESRNGNKLPWVFGALAIGCLVWLIMIVVPKFNEPALDKVHQVIQENEVEARAETNSALHFFIPREGFYITPIILGLNLLIFILMVISGLGFISFKAIDLLHWGGNFRPLTSNGEWWRLVTNTFLHGGIMHILANMYGLIFVGIFLEPKLGRVKFALVYLATGVLASLASLWWHPATVSVGASGAIFGLYGIFLALMLTKIFPGEIGKAFLSGTLLFIGYNLLMGLGGGIDNAAHIGGLLSGFIIGLILYPGLKRQEKEKEFLVAETEVFQN